MRFYLIASLFLVSLNSHGYDKNHPCIKDAEKFCIVSTYESEQITECLNQKKTSLSKECKNHNKKIEYEISKFGKPCKEDASKYCKHIIVGKESLLSCLKFNAKELSKECWTVVRQKWKKPN